MKHNYLYGLLTSGITTFRHTSVYTIDNPNALQYIACLVPPYMTERQKAYLAEFYLKLLRSDAEAVSLLNKVDPYNSYTLAKYDIVLNPEEFIDIERLYYNILAAKPQFNTHGITMIDCFINVLKALLRELPTI